MPSFVVCGDVHTEGCVGSSIAFLFPGQGSQAVGMGADVYAASPAARAVYALADRTLGFPLSQLCFEGPEATLRETINTQPALVATSLAMLAALQEAIGATPADKHTESGEPSLATPIRPALVAGHSVGEYAALACAGVLSISETLRLVRERGRLMHAEGTRCASGMAAILGMDRTTLETVCAEATERARAALGDAANAPDAHPGLGRVVLANENAPGQIVISGEQSALDVAVQLAKERGAKRALPLAVSGAFHSPVMGPAATAMGEAVRATRLDDATIPVVANISARPLTTAAELTDELSHQVDSAVLWMQTVQAMDAQGITLYVEIGAGQVLSGLVKRIVKGAETLSLASAADLPAVAQRLRAAE